MFWQNDEINIGTLSAQTSLANTTLTVMSDSMESSGLIVRKSDLRDCHNRVLVISKNKIHAGRL